MSKDSVKQMFGKMEKDEALKGKYAELMQAHQKDTENKLAEKLIELGKTSGFAFSKEELLAARAELMDKNNSNKELSDDDLEKVAGGGFLKTGTIVVSILTAGIGCAILSIQAASNPQSRGCASQLTTIDPNCKNR